HEVMPLGERLQRLQGVPEDHVGVVRLDGDAHTEPTAVAEPTQFLPGGVVPAARLFERERERLDLGGRELHAASPTAKSSLCIYLPLSDAMWASTSSSSHEEPATSA